MMGDTKLKAIRMSDVEVRVDGTQQVRALQKVMTRTVRSATRSDRLAAALYENGLGIDDIAKKMKLLSEAESHLPRQVWNPETQEWETKQIPVPDFKIQRDIIKMAIDVHGASFQLPRDDRQMVPPVLIQVYKDYRSEMQQKNPFALAEEQGIIIDEQGNIITDDSNGTDDT